MNVLIYDFETNSPDPDTCHVVQVAALLVCGDIEIAQLETLIQLPDGVTIPEGARKVHGISAEDTATGQTPEQTFGQLSKMMQQADRIVGHNIIGFDNKILRRYRKQLGHDKIPGLKSFDTMKAATNVMKLPLTPKQQAAQARYPDWTPPGGWPKYKSPNLGEAYEFFTGNELVGAHDAMVDVRACLEVYWVITNG